MAALDRRSSRREVAVRSWASGASIQREGSAVLVSLSTSQLLTFPCRAEVPRLQDEGGSTSSLVPLQRFNGSTVHVTEG
jgi:hypothetical protein